MEHHQGGEQHAEERSAVRPHVVHRAVRLNGERELRRSNAALWWSGLAAGLSAGLSFIAEAVLSSHLPAADWRPLVAKFGYPVGFLVIILGRQQLFTENTLTPVLVLLDKRDSRTFGRLVALWGVVLAANIAGAHIVAWVLSNPGLFQPEVYAEFDRLAIEASDVSFWLAILRGIFAGWIIALIVWILAATENAHFWIIVSLTYVIGIGGFTHVIIGSVETLFLVMTGAKTWLAYAGGYLVPALIGNVIGGVSLVSALSHAQIAADGENNKDEEQMQVEELAVRK